MVADRRPTGQLAELRAAARSVRGRTTISVLLVVALACLAGGLTLLAVLRVLIAEDTAKAARLRVNEMSRQVSEALASQHPLVDLPVSDPNDEFVQVIDANGLVVGGSANVGGLAPQIPPASDRPVEIDGPLEESPVVVVSGSAYDGNARYTVLVGHSLYAVGDATRVIVEMLAVGLPLLLTIIGLTIWISIGRALAPVEAIRSEVDSISSVLDRRVPVPDSDDEIARLARNMNGMLSRIEATMQRQRRFVADASHELRSPVAAIRQHAEVSLADPSRYAGEELAGSVLSETLRVQHLIDDLLLLASADEKLTDARRDPVDLDDLVFAEADKLRSSTTLQVEVGSVSAGRVDGDSHALQRLLRNLVDNAARHAVARISLGLSERGPSGSPPNGPGPVDGPRTVTLTVADDGPGIPEADRTRVLERFVRLDTARTRGDGGGGLGLAIVAEVARAHHATVRIDDGPLGGARIELEFPASTDSA